MISAAAVEYNLVLILWLIFGGVGIRYETSTVRCDGFLAEATCGNATHSMVLSADICDKYVPNTKCEKCITLEKFEETMENFELCKFQVNNITSLIYKRAKTDDVLKAKAKYKRLQKRQVSRRRNSSCRSIEPPKPGKMSCKIYPGSMICAGTCNSGYRFVDGSTKVELNCAESEGIWRPQSVFADCEPQCNPPCQNGGSCFDVNSCFCGNEFRGSSCEYSINLCGIEKTSRASSWSCNHTRVETLCSIACHPPGTYEALRDSRIYACSFTGNWNPQLPSCVQKNGVLDVVHWCPKPGFIENGKTNDDDDSAKPPGTNIRYTCFRGFSLQGQSESICQTDGTWSGQKPTCVESPVSELCADPGDVDNAWKQTSTNHFTVGSIVSYTCYPDYKMFGEPDLVCLSKRQWSSSKPACIRMNNMEGRYSGFCSYSEAPHYTEVKVHAHTNRESFWETEQSFEKQGSNSDQFRSFAVGTRIQYRCISKYYKLHGSEYQTCQDTGLWSGNRPTCVPECGKSDSPKTPFIVHGNATTIGQWPWQVAIYVEAPRDKPHLTCGGALLNEKWIITAAHCVTTPHSNSKIDIATMTVYAGKYYRSFVWDDDYVQKRFVRRLIVHQNYDFIKFDYDIALVEIDLAIVLTGRVQPICLPSDKTTNENLKDGKRGIVIGWGLTEEGKFSEILRENVLPVVSHSQCEDSYRQGLRSITVTDNMFCAGYDRGKVDTCVGDSGGPMMFLDESQRPKRWILEGIVSWGSGDGCGQANKYAGFTKVKPFVDWIKMTTS